MARDLSWTDNGIETLPHNAAGARHAEEGLGVASEGHSHVESSLVLHTVELKTEVKQAEEERCEAELMPFKRILHPISYTPATSPHRKPQSIEIPIV
jgi:hypothetical protein